jgi:hypothetical protein
MCDVNTNIQGVILYYVYNLGIPLKLYLYYNIIMYICVRVCVCVWVGAYHINYKIIVCTREKLFALITISS